MTLQTAMNEGQLAKTEPSASRLVHWAVDLDFARRTLAARPVGTGFVVVVLAVVIGLCTAFASLWGHARLGHAVPEPERLFEFRAGSYVRTALMQRWRSECTGCVEIGGAGSGREVLEGDPTTQVKVTYVTPGWFEALAPTVVVGRTLRPSDYQDPGAAADAAVARAAAKIPVLISHRLWVRRWGQAPNVIGEDVVLQNGISGRVVGVVGAAFEYPQHRGHGTEIWVPLTSRSEFTGFRITLRGRPGASLEGIRSELVRVRNDWIEKSGEAPVANRNLSLQEAPTKDVGIHVAALLAGAAAAAFLLIAGAASSGVHLLSRFLARQREHGLALAVGATVGRLRRQALLAGVLLAIAGGLGSMPVAWLCMTLVKRHFVIALDLNPSFRLARLDGDSLLLTIFAVAVVAVIIGLPAALQIRSAGIDSIMRRTDLRHSGSRAGRRARGGLLAAQVALATALLVYAGAVLGDVAERVRELGFDPTGVTFLRVDYQNEELHDRQTAFEQKTLAEIARLPGVEAAALVWPEPFGHYDDQSDTMSFFVEGRAQNDASARADAIVSSASGALLRVLDIPLKAGRWFSPDGKREPESVLVVDQGFADKYLAGLDPLSVRLRLVSAQLPKPRVFAIVGVVGSVKIQSQGEQRTPMVYAPDDGSKGGITFRDPSVDFLVRSREAPQVMSARLRSVVRRVEPRQAVADTGRYLDLIGKRVISPLFQAAVMGGFGLLALGLAGVGLNGAARAVVVARRNELGIRKALGASSAQLVALVLVSAVGPVVAGTLVGLLLVKVAFVSSLRGVLTIDPSPAIIIGAVTLVIASATVGITVPAWRASRASAWKALRHE